MVLLVVDESSKGDEVHLFRIALPYLGHSLSLVWDVWPQNEKLTPKGEYWT
jgi:hypothetical protein